MVGCPSPTATQEQHDTKQVAYVIPETRIGIGVDSIVSEQTPYQAEHDGKAMKQAVEKTRHFVGGYIGLCGTGSQSEDQSKH